MHDIWIALITITGSLFAGLVVAWASFRVAREARRDQRQRDVENAMADFLAAISKAVGELRDLPYLDERHPIVAFSRLSAKVSDTLAPGRQWIRNRERMREVLGDTPFLRAERVVDAAARLRVLDPGPEMTTALDECLEYAITLGSDRTKEQLDRWPGVHAELLSAIEATRRRLLNTRAR